jgi:fumarylpyruvate hydrolase
VLALADGGADITVSGAEQLIFGYGIGIDFTRRDVQNEMKKKGWPWDMAKGFDFSAPISQIYPKKDFGDPSKLDITLDVNEARKQHGKISDMIWNVHEVIAHLSTFVRLKAGDIIFTGTPEGVGPVLSSDLIVAKCGPAELQVKIA